MKGGTMSEPGTANDVTPSSNQPANRLLKILADHLGHQCYLVDRSRGRVAVYAPAHGGSRPVPVPGGSFNRASVDTARSAGLVDFGLVPVEDLPAEMHQAVLTFEGASAAVRRIAAIGSDWTVTGLQTMQARLRRLETDTIYAVHLVRAVKGKGTLGPALCGMDRFAPGAGWSLGGGTYGPGVVQRPCDGCVETARFRYPGMAVSGTLAIAEPIAAKLGVEVRS
jgi:hypothetical protein